MLFDTSTFVTKVLLFARNNINKYEAGRNQLSSTLGDRNLSAQAYNFIVHKRASEMSIRRVVTELFEKFLFHY